MEKRETFKDIKIGEREFRIQKFNARIGSWIAFKLFTKMLPGGMDAKLGASVSGLPKNRDIMNKEEFFELQNDCLNACFELLKAGPVPVIGLNGAFGVADLENDAMTVMLLTIHVLVFNVAGFFDGNALKELTKNLSGISLANVKM